ncbi:acyl-CoA-binding domain-containing protein 1-like [Ananas comosus]|uniref:Acyl-CoA-binding domain-containing protein 1-like n=1 Tax=Ananas comosus TaxID=4615 RepID=A0A6P5E9U9_ANACO|nr:acyl-CoA-binding domain-containing protein 1-like [Ananas comosus]
MGDWQELGQAVFIGLIFAFLVAKLISIVLSFKEDHLKLSRDENVSVPSEIAEAGGVGAADAASEERDPLRGESLLGESDDSDWEGIESTELDEEFSAASTFVATTAADRAASAKVSNDVQLQLYGLYKIATEGPCTAPQPSPLKMTARAKWNAWQKLGAMPPEEAMLKYISIVNELYPSWASGSTIKRKKEDSAASTSAAKGSMGPVFSSFVHEEESENDLKLDPIHIAAREGALDDFRNLINGGVSVNLRDSEGRTPLHWAVDRGHPDVVEVLLKGEADVNAKDHEGQTPLHYAAVCDREAIAQLLVEHHADRDIKDDDGSTPLDLCQSEWAFMTTAS